MTEPGGNHEEPTNGPSEQEGQAQGPSAEQAPREENPQEVIARVYHQSFDVKARGIIESYDEEKQGVVIDALTYSIFPRIEGVTDEQRQSVNEKWKDLRDAPGPLKEALEEQKGDHNAAVERHFEANTNEELRKLFEESGLTQKYKDAFIRAQLFPLEVESGDAAKILALRMEVDQTVKANPDFKKAYEKFGQERLDAEIKREVPESETEEEEVKEEPPENETDEQKTDREAREKAEFEQKQKRLDDEAREAMEASINDPLDVDLRRKAAAKIQEARQHHDKEHADEIVSPNPWWTYAINALGVAFYAFVALEYVASSAAVAYGESGGKGK